MSIFDFDNRKVRHNNTSFAIYSGVDRYIDYNTEGK